MIKIFKNKFFWIFLATFCLLFLVISSSLFFYFKKEITKSSGAENFKIVEIKKGEGVNQIADKLKNEGIINNPLAFKIYVFITKKETKIKAGEFLLSPSMNIIQIVKVLEEGQESFLKVTIPEGWKIKEISNYLESEKIFSKEDFLKEVNSLEKWQKEFAFLKIIPKDKNLEGFLYPDTYFISKNSSPEVLVRKMLVNFEQKVIKKYESEINNSKYNLYQIVILASIIEKEASKEEDRLIISDIFQKRLEKNIPLQSCATVEYILETKKHILSLQDIKINSPYNTYLYSGLPPGPICNPSVISIKAVLYPQKTNYWYFLSDSNGNTYFQKTIQEHEAAKLKYLK